MWKIIKTSGGTRMKNDSNQKLTLKNGSVIYFAPARQTEQIRGLSVLACIIDDDFRPDEFKKIEQDSEKVEGEK